MFQKISGNIISGRSRDILWRSLEIYRKKPGTHSSKIGKAIFRILKKSKSLEADIAISQLPKNQSFWPCHCPHGWWTPRASSASSSQDPGELRQSETPAFAPGTGPQAAAFFFWGRRIRGFHVSFSHHFPHGFCPKSCGFSWIFPLIPHGFQSCFTHGCRPRWCRQNLGTWFSRVEIFLCLSYSSKKLKYAHHIPLYCICIACVMCTAKPSIWEYLGKSSGKYENLRKFSKKNPEHRWKSMNILRKIIIIIFFIYYPYTL